MIHKDVTDRFSPYFAWVQAVCKAKNIRINGEMAQIENKTHFRMASSAGDLYLKKMGDFFNDGLAFTLKLMTLEITAMPKWVDYDHVMKLCLMYDMGGCDLSLLSQLDMQMAVGLLISLAHIQKKSVPFVASKGCYGFDYRVDTMLEDMVHLPETAYDILYDTPYRITRDETKKLKQNTQYAASILQHVKNAGLPLM